MKNTTTATTGSDGDRILLKAIEAQKVWSISAELWRGWYDEKVSENISLKVDLAAAKDEIRDLKYELESRPK